MTPKQYSMNIVSNDGVTDKTINVTTSDANEIKRLVNLAGIIDPATTLPVHAPLVPVPQPPPLPAVAKMPSIVPQLPMPEIDHNIDPNLIDRPFDFDPKEEMERGMHEICDDGPNHSDLNCSDCGNCMDHCACDHDQIDESLTDNDYSRNGITGKGKVVNSDTYNYKIPAYKQRIVKGNLGDNALAENIYKKLSNRYEDFLAESEDSVDNAAGIMSPLTQSGRSNFNPDPQADEDPVDDGSRSPLSKIIRQKIAK